MSRESGYRFSEEDMRQRKNLGAHPDSNQSGCAPAVQQPCDILLSGGFVITMERPQSRLLWPGSVAIRGADIVAAGPSTEVEAYWRASLRLDCSTHAVLPGLVNSHVHAGMSLLKSRAGDRPLRRRLSEVVWP